MKSALVAIQLTLTLALGACGDLPRDPDGTLDHVRAAKVIRLGTISGATEDAAAEATLRKLAERTGARIDRRAGHGEELLESLEAGELDLVYGHFADDSPWAAKVHFGTPPAGPRKPPKSQRVARFAYQMGENGWIAAVEEAAR